MSVGGVDILSGRHMCGHSSGTTAAENQGLKHLPDHQKRETLLLRYSMMYYSAVFLVGDSTF